MPNNTLSIKCHICESDIKRLFKAKILNKYIVSYFKCNQCGFIQTEEPYWLNEAYNNAISAIDVGIVQRNLRLSKLIGPILKKHFNYRARFIDYGGGYGLFVRLMRDYGFDFYRQDVCCRNIFAPIFDIKYLEKHNDFELVTAFEVFEHLVRPIGEISKMFEYSDSILFSTELQPMQNINNISDWQYFWPEAGQHISFYTKKSLEIISDTFNCYLYSNYKNLHLMTPRKLSSNPFHTKIIFKIVKRIIESIRNYFDRKGLDSLIQNDIKTVSRKIEEV